MARIRVRVTPRSARNSIDGLDAAGVWRVKVTAPPADGKANAAVVRLIARSLGVPMRQVAIVSGASARVKTVEINGRTAEEIADMLGSTANP